MRSDFVSCTQEVSATPLLDLQSSPSFKGYFPGLVQVIIRDYVREPHYIHTCMHAWHLYAHTTPRSQLHPDPGTWPQMAADQVLKPRYGAGAPGVVAVNCSASGCELDGLSISSAGLDVSHAVRVYRGTVAGESKSLVVESPWSQFISECPRF
eukprot:COSAG01_NODE_2091_length_8453_cov_19.448049_9_plen_153_part_00